MSQIVTDANGQKHEFPDTATPEMIAQALGIKPPKKTTFLESIGNVLGAAGEGAAAAFEGYSPPYNTGTITGNIAQTGRGILDIASRAVQAPIEAVARGGGQIVEEFGGGPNYSPETGNQKFQRDVRALANTVGFVAGASPMVAAPFSGAVAREAAVPTTAALKASSKAAYNQAEAANLVVSQNAMGRMADELATALKNSGFDRQLHPGAAAALDRITGATSADITFQDLEILHRIANGAKKSNVTNPDQARIAGIITDKLDDFMDNLMTSDVVSGNAQQAAEQVKIARSLWARARKAEHIEEALDAAGLNASATWSGGNIENNIRQQFKRLLTNKSISKKWTADEAKLIRGVVAGAPMRNVARLIGKLSPEGSGLMMMMQIGGLGLSGGGSLPLPLMGMAAKRFADAATRKAAMRTLEKVQGGTAEVPFQLRQPSVGLGAGLTSSRAIIPSEQIKRRGTGLGNRGM